MSTDINKQVLKEVQSSKYGFVMRLDKTIDVSNCAQLLVFVRYATKSSIRSKLLSSNESRTTTRGADVFELVDNFSKKMVFDRAS